MNRSIVTIMISLVTVAGFSAGSLDALAFDEEQYRTVKVDQAPCIFCDLTGADLTKVNLTGVDLTGADFTEADLSGAVLRNADLTSADFTDAVMVGTDFTGAKLVEAEFNRVDLSNAILEGAKLEGAYCDWATKLPEDLELSCDGVLLTHE
jgi:uncharacterized protein YjbI with pentapeptide repeats